jgi:hypothetical protein
MDGALMDLGGRVSRKKDYIPTITSVIKDGWKKPRDLGRGLSMVDVTQLGKLEVDPNDPHGNVTRVGSVLDSPEMKGKRTCETAEEKIQEEKKDDVEDEPISI